MLDIEAATEYIAERMMHEDTLDDRLNAAFRAAMHFPCDTDVLSATKIILALSVVQRAVAEDYAVLISQVIRDIPAFMRYGRTGILPPRWQDVVDVMNRWNEIKEQEYRLAYALGIEMEEDEIW